MIVVVRDGTVELYSYDTEQATDGLSPASADIDDVKAALQEALAYLGDDDDV
jgi:hypothetical protein